MPVRQNGCDRSRQERGGDHSHAVRRTTRCLPGHCRRLQLEDLSLAFGRIEKSVQWLATHVDNGTYPAVTARDLVCDVPEAMPEELAVAISVVGDQEVDRAAGR